ncbi:bifunctional cytochrome P450/NADPH--P450 reductase [Priestia aryabhattai]|uniref:bifunctional cytochrome P450/NADPH--P450 reductase n=1 Tax=Priestia aryabhattai TaxID=412384 RepID=UPI00288246AA|nr:bifunctional cytochrome P450/NADPH--P450 reductase [Priestia aryabhattai]MDT0150203.1 bifunctional cytochrome P450/NADPH--P450 reductase [Priestia aryabhattai]MDT0155769.1 bifunctional cytochrome P450/NADPH--P450 reductase [Priestia aryabhattai]
MNKTINIPKPKTFGPLGHLPLINKNNPALSLGKLADEYGPIFRFKTPSSERLLISGSKLVEEICNGNQFDKSIGSGLEKVRAFTGDGLFTSRTNEPNWKRAHNILLPAFSQRAMKGYHSMMVDIAVQLVQKWARLNPNEIIDVPEDMTRLTLDTIGLCGFNYRFNSYYRETPHPFINSMVRALDEVMQQAQRLDIQDKLMVRTRRKFRQDIQSMFSLVDNIISKRKENETQDGKDLLSLMLNGRDPDTGEKLDDENIRYQIITFLIAGHETTSGLLSFALYFLLKNPDKLKKAYEEVDQILTDSNPTYKQVLELKYIRMILNESLRLWPTAPSFSLYAKEDIMLEGKYSVKQGELVTVLISQLHRDKEAWGDDVEDFRPERFKDPSKVPNYAYKPFGNGQRACIGMQFALHEATLVLGMILQHFELIDHTNYELNIKQTLTLKPSNFKIRIQKRNNEIIGSNPSTLRSKKETCNYSRREKQIPLASIIELNNRPLLVLYGSDTGTAEGIARELAEAASLHGVRSEVATLNDRIGNLPNEGIVLIVTSSYNGKPPSNAEQFVQWLEQVNPGELDGVCYAVFGCGDHNWASTYQYVPKFIDEQLSLKGATRFSERGEADASGDFEDQLAQWKSNMWSDAINAFGLQPNKVTDKGRGTLNVQFLHNLERSHLAQSYEAVCASISENYELQLADSERSTRHIEVILPEGVTYQEGDYLGILPSNSKEIVNRVLQRYGLKGNTLVTSAASGHNKVHLPLDRPASLFNLLSYNIEVQGPATRIQIRKLADFTICPPHKLELEALLEESTYKEQILNKQISMLDLLEKYEACEMPFKHFLELSHPIKPKFYWISSSPKMSPKHVSITVDVVHAPALSGRGEYRGITSNYLANRKSGKDITMFIRKPESQFQLPEDPEKPIIMVGSGIGIAPFRGFLQARAAMKKEEKAIGEAHLYFGCKNETDFIYREELEKYEKDEIVNLHTAFSHMEGVPKMHVQHLVDQYAKHLIHILDEGGKLYICGTDEKMVLGVEKILKETYQSAHNVSEQEANKWVEHLKIEDNYVKEVWTSI